MKTRIVQIGLFFAALAALAVEPSIKVTVEGESRFVYEPFSLKVDVTSESDPERPVVADGTGYNVSSISQGYRLPYNQRDTTTFRVEIVPSQPGVITISPVEVRVGDEVVSSSPLRLTVDEPHTAEGMNIEVSFNMTNLYVHQAVEMKVVWQSQTPFIQYQELVMDLPVLRSRGLAVYPLEPDVPEKNRIGLPVNEQRVIAEKFSGDNGEGLCFRFMLIPHEAGVFGSGNMHLACALMKDKQNSNQYPSYFNNNFFSNPDSASRFERVYLVSSMPKIYVKELPEKGRSPLFCGVAGDLSAATSVNPTEVIVGQPMMFEVELSGMTYGGQVTELPEVILSNIGPSFKITPDPIRETSTATSHKFVYALRPLRCEVSLIPALALQVFNPMTGRYRMVRTQPVNIKVEPDEDKRIYVPGDFGDDDIMVPLSGIRGNRKQSGALMNGYNLITFVGERAWFFWLLAPVLWICLYKWIRHLERCRKDAAYARSARALRVFKGVVNTDEEGALRGYLADRFGLCAEAITAESCAVELRKRDLSSEVVEMALECFRSIDSRKYSPAKKGGASRDRVIQLVKAVERQTKILVLLLLLIPAVVTAQSPDDYFKAAMKVQAERPDEAHPLFVQAALGFEESGAFFNAGNSWFFAGESGRALAAYLSAESRAPFNREIRDSIGFIRAQRSDGFEIEKGVTTGISRLWKGVCRWDSRLRLGVLTLMYLAAWYIGFLYRVFGWRPGRRFCVTYGIVMGFIALTLVYSAFQPSRGVVIQSASARLGPGYAYGPAYESVLSQAAEFEWLGRQGEWVKARLPDGTEGWLHESAGVKVR